jgi:plasmid stabilization system protein ParE
MARVKWLPEAIVDFERLYYFLLDKDFDAANKAASNIVHGTALLETTPRIGRPMEDDKNRRELFVSFGAGAYVIRYRLESNENETVVIVRIWHSRERR